MSSTFFLKLIYAWIMGINKCWLLYSTTRDTLQLTNDFAREPEMTAGHDRFIVLDIFLFKLRFLTKALKDF